QHLDCNAAAATFDSTSDSPPPPTSTRFAKTANELPPFGKPQERHIVALDVSGFGSSSRVKDCHGKGKTRQPEAPFINETKSLTTRSEALDKLRQNLGLATQK
ncbi:hypothetical protein L916_21250, partial [Phytophthora nicotianae]